MHIHKKQTINLADSYSKENIRNLAEMTDQNKKNKIQFTQGVMNYKQNYHIQ